jgi:hypothetical protein
MFHKLAKVQALPMYGVVMVVSKNQLHAHAIETGERIWSSKPAPEMSLIDFVQTPKPAILVAAIPHMLIAIEPQTGATLWEKTVPIPPPAQFDENWQFRLDETSEGFTLCWEWSKPLCIGIPHDPNSFKTLQSKGRFEFHGDSIIPTTKICRSHDWKPLDASPWTIFDVDDKVGLLN